MIHHIFVYGTLKTGQLREACWPSPPLSVHPAIVRGELFDLGAYPALMPGGDLVEGEAWQLAESDLSETLRVLDQIEDFSDSAQDLYKRVAIECTVYKDGFASRGSIVQAQTYHYATSLDGSLRVRPDINGRCCWPST